MAKPHWYKFEWDDEKRRTAISSTCAIMESNLTRRRRVSSMIMSLQKIPDGLTTFMFWMGGPTEADGYGWSSRTKVEDSREYLPVGN